jgi:hypothetical protein
MLATIRHFRESNGEVVFQERQTVHSRGPPYCFSRRICERLFDFSDGSGYVPWARSHTRPRGVRPNKPALARSRTMTNPSPALITGRHEALCSPRGSSSWSTRVGGRSGGSVRARRSSDCKAGLPGQISNCCDSVRVKRPAASAPFCSECSTKRTGTRGRGEALGHPVAEPDLTPSSRSRSVDSRVSDASRTSTASPRRVRFGPGWLDAASSAVRAPGGKRNPLQLRPGRRDHGDSRGWHVPREACLISDLRSTGERRLSTTAGSRWLAHQTR